MQRITKQWPVRLEIKRHLVPRGKWHWCVVFNGGHIFAISETFESAEACMADAAGAGLDALHGAETRLTDNVPGAGPGNNGNESPHPHENT